MAGHGNRLFLCQGRAGVNKPKYSGDSGAGEAWWGRQNTSVVPAFRRDDNAEIPYPWLRSFSATFGAK